MFFHTTSKINIASPIVYPRPRLDEVLVHTTAACDMLNPREYRACGIFAEMLPAEQINTRHFWFRCAKNAVVATSSTFP